MVCAMTENSLFADRNAIDASIEETAEFAPKFDAAGLIPAAVTDAATGQFLMLAYMNAEALSKTLLTGDAWYWSRSRQKLWRKGESSGNSQSVREIRTDCDQDAILLVVDQSGPACHTNRRSCFYRIVESSEAGAVLKFS